jgi:hypothetical protein
MSGLTWLHISDWLHKREKELDRQVIRAALIRSIRGRTAIGPDISMVDFIIVSGNIAHSGNAEEYDAAKGEIFDRLLKPCGAGPDRLFIVPGDYDMDRTVFENLRPRSRSLPDLRKRHTEKSEVRGTWTEKS